jgi:hypothetical protein
MFRILDYGTGQRQRSCPVCHSRRRLACDTLMCDLACVGEVRNGMDIVVGSRAARGLQRYVRLVAEELGLIGEASCTEPESPANAYLALAERVPSHPDRNAALLWDECHGWAGAIEAAAEDDLTVLAYLGHDVLPAPRLAARFAQELTAGLHPGSIEPPAFRTPDSDDDLPERLAAYAPPPGNSCS